MDRTMWLELEKQLTDEPDVLVAYLHGSEARGKAGPASDVDIAVLLDPAVDHFRRRLELTTTVAEIVGSDKADVVVLNDAPVALGYRVLRDGKIIMCRDDKARIGYFVKTVGRHLDMAPVRRMFAEGTRNRLQEGRFGRR